LHIIRLNTIKNRKTLIFYEIPRTPANAGAKGYGIKGEAFKNRILII